MPDVLLGFRLSPPRVVASLILLFAGLIFPTGMHAAPTEDGLYAEFQITRGGIAIGEFTCKLEFEKVPRTVANFIGLAEGTLPFVDFQKGNIVKRKFYDGITFHRVVANFVIQGGSPKGDGSDGPGYAFPDEFDATLRHSKAGVLSMANSGLNSNGSQFFVTLAATPGLDDVHSVFGEVVEGMVIVTNVQQGDVIQNVTITRNGTAAIAFDAAAHGVPIVDDAGPALQKTLSGFQLNYTQPANSEFFVFHSGELTNWLQLPGKEMHGPSATITPRDVTAATVGNDAQYFTVARVRYPDPVLTTANVASKALSLIDVGGLTLNFQLTAQANGTFVLTPNGQPPINGTVNSYSWTQDAYRGRLAGSISGLSDGGGNPITQMNISFSFSALTAGTYRGSLINILGQPINIAGSFGMSDL